MEQNTDLRQKISRSLSIGLCLAATLVAGNATAAVIEIEPDDYAEGTDLSNVSPYVTLSHETSAHSWPPQSVHATAPQFDFPAPTGNLTFGVYGAGPGSCDGEIRLGCFAGFGMSFHQPVDEVSLLAINSGYPPGLGAWWAAFDSDGAMLAGGIEHGETTDNYGIPFELKVDVPDMASLVAGGSGLTNVIEFDRLVIQVPEPGAWSLLGLGLLGLYLKTRKRPAKAAT